MREPEKQTLIIKVRMALLSDQSCPPSPQNITKNDEGYSRQTMSIIANKSDSWQ